MQEIETTTVTIKKTDIEFLKTYVYGMDSTVQNLCITVLSKELNSKLVGPNDAKDTKLKIGKISLASSESRYQVLKILSEAK